MRQISGKRLLLTGATGSLGKSLAIRLCAEGASLVLPVRSEQKGEALRAELIRRFPDVELSFPLVDLSDEQSVQALAAALVAEGRPLDGLILNAGVFTAAGRRSPQGNEWHLQVNCLSPTLLTHALLPLLRRSESPCVVTVTSLSAFWPLREGDTPTRLYAASKRALLREMAALAGQETGIAFVYAHPGVCATGLFRGGSDKTAYPTAFLRMALPLMERLFPSPEKACLTTLTALKEAESGQLAEPGGLLHIWGRPVLVSLEECARR